ncbi:MAG: sodium:solute symporter [Bacteroidaceae bacterium]|nr:sodium:solute symporter [Bacteroidaceae bacterium]
MSNLLVFSALGLYILLLVLFTRLVKTKGDNNAFFRAGRRSPWLLVAFGMIGASISGVSLVSVPGWVHQNGMTYIQMCLGFFAGFVCIAFLLLPLYYRLRLTSIYGYLAERFGRRSHLTGACFFLLSKLTGAAARLFLTCTVLHEMAIRPLGLPFAFTVGVVLLAIFLYTRKGGIENIVRTDALQTFCMLLATGCIVWGVSMKMNLTPSGIAETIASSPMGQMFCWDTSSTQFFLRQFINGMFITIVMNGLDQDMMQKNLTCSSLRSAQKNMCLYGFCILPVNLLFLALGVLLYTFAAQEGLAIPDAGDRLLPMLVGQGALGTFVVFPFTIGITAAALSSADSAMTSLTTSICVDILKIEEDGVEAENALRTRHRVHVAVALAFALCIAVFHIAGSGTIIDTIYRLAGYTYGPLLGLFSFGLFTRRTANDQAVPCIAVISPIICAFLDYLAPLLWNYRFSYELLLLNAALTFLGLLVTSRPVPGSKTTR